ncbi:MAG TPA: PilZ domain-containing protein [Sulfurivirga caldicuralii]|nr:PilZ domain-containing protein [Sulfurivirga caldicuralii]
MNGRQNKRAYYRLNTMLPLSYRILSAEEAKANPIPTETDATFIEKHFLANLQQIDQQLQQAIDTIGRKSDLLASALHALNSKVNLALQAIDKRQLAHLLPLTRVNLSASGLALELPLRPKETDKLDILMQPLTDETPILVRGRIVNIQPLPEKGANIHRVAVEFDNLTENARRKLIYYIQRKELEQAQIERAKQEN